MIVRNISNLRMKNVEDSCVLIKPCDADVKDLNCQG